MKKAVSLLLMAALVAASCLIIVSPVKAASKTIVVPDDFSTISSAIGNATNGDAILVRSGIYLEHSLTIDKTISLIGEKASNTIIKDIDPQTPLFASSIMVGPTAITISADNVVISGFTITNASPDIEGGGSKTQIIGNNLPDGILLSSGSYQIIAQNNAGLIRTGAPNTFIVNNSLSGAGLILSVGDRTNADNSVVYENTIANGKTSVGIDVYETQGNLIAKNTITGGNAGIMIDLCGNNIIEANTVTNSFIGLSVIQGGSDNTFYANNIVNNNYAVALCGLNDRLYDNNFVNNVQQIGSPNLLGGPNPVASTLWYKGTQGNYWSDYASKYPNASEVDTSGVGDTTYLIDANNTDLYPLMAPYDNSNLTIPLPQWANLELATSLPTASFPPIPASSQTNPTPKQTPLPTTNSSTQQSTHDSKQTQPTQTENLQPFLSPLIIAALIIALVALFGTILSLYLRWRDRKLKQ